VILKRFNRQSTQGSSSNSDSLALSASDWKKIRQLVDQAVTDRDQRKISKLNQTIHRLSVRSMLTEHENTRLKKAFINERLCRKRGKVLPLEQGEEYHSGAVFWCKRVTGIRCCYSEVIALTRWGVSAALCAQYILDLREIVEQHKLILLHPHLYCA
jgi:hypothetical protein